MVHKQTIMQAQPSEVRRMTEYLPLDSVGLGVVTKCTYRISEDLLVLTFKNVFKFIIIQI